MSLLKRPAVLLVTACVLLMGRPDARSAEHTLIPAGAVWRYNDSGANLGTAWRAPGYADSSWSQGAAQLGYGDDDETTVISYGASTSNRHITYYFRHSVEVTSPSAFAAVTARFIRDDGAVIFINGIEITRSNMPAGTVTSTTLASSAVSGSAESQWFEVPVDPTVLVAGTNVVAVEIHQSSASSSDVSFDFELRATEAQVPPPTVTLVSPADKAVTNQSSATFTAALTAPAGLAEAALYISGPPNTVTFSGPSQVEDAEISADAPAVNNGTGTGVNVDGLSPHAHGLMRFPTLVGEGAGQVPAGAIITSATIQVDCTNAGDLMGLYRLTEDWLEAEVTWNERSAGVPWSAPGADGVLSNAGVVLGGSCTSTGLRLIDITRFVQEWSNGEPNYGIVFTDTGTDGVDFSSSESANSPVLTVVYKDGLVPISTQPVSGTTATVQFPASMTQPGTWYWNVQATDVDGAQSWASVDFEFTADPALPDEPVLVSPGHGANDAAPTGPLQVMVSDPSGGPLTVTASLRRAAQPAFTIVALPDTQHYSEAFPAIFTTQTQWIRDNKSARNIVFVTHEGDIVQNAGVESEWIAANTSMSLMDGVVPYGMAPGNHDQPSTLYNVYFPFTRYLGLPWYGGHYQSLNDNNYQLFSGGGMDFVAVHLEFCPPAGALTWARDVLNSFPNRIGMMTTHGFLNESAQRTVHVCGSTQYIWDALAPFSPNLHFILSGHVHDESRRADVLHGHPIFQMLADYQGRPSGGQGWLRMLRFVPADNKVYVQTYSPWLNQYETDANSEFALDFPMAGEFETVGTSVVPSLSTAVFPLSLVEPDTEYEWQVTVTNAQGKSRTGPVWRFSASTSTIHMPPDPVTVFSADFNRRTDRFTYVDDAFRGTRRPAYASGARVSRGGHTGGALRVDVGGVDNKSIANMSGGWQRSFTLDAPATVTLSFRYALNQGSDYERDEFSEVLVSVNGVLYSTGPADWIAHVAGNGNGGRPVTTGWHLADVNLGLLPAGTHTLTLGGFNNKKSSTAERTTILIDDVTVRKR